MNHIMAEQATEACWMLNFISVKRLAMEGDYKNGVTQSLQIYS